jgi:hypothetical protein
MIYSDYSWTASAGDNPKIAGTPDNALFNRHEGYEVLHLINRIMSDRSLITVDSGQKMEKMIREDLPSNVRGRVHVTDWINDNW